MSRFNQYTLISYTRIYGTNHDNRRRIHLIKNRIAAHNDYSYTTCNINFKKTLNKLKQHTYV